MFDQEKLLKHCRVAADAAFVGDLAGCEAALVRASNMIWAERHGKAAAKRQAANRPWAEPKVARLVPRV